MNNNEEYKKPTIAMQRFRWIYLAISLVFLFYGAQLFQYQVIEHDVYQAQADANRTNTISIPTQRGMIF